MKVLLVTIGSHGDVHPFVGIGVALRRRGHEVTLVTNSHFESLARSAGLEFLTLGTEDEFRDLIKDPDLWHTRNAFKAVFSRGALPLMEQTYELIRDHYVPGETVVVASCLALGARVAHEKLGVPLVSAQTSPTILRTLHDVPKLPGLFMPWWFPKWLKSKIWEGGDKFVIDPVVAPGINDFRVKVGLTTRVNRVLMDWWNSPQLVLGMWPEWFAATQPDWPTNFHSMGFPLYDETGITPIPQELEDWLNAGTPPIAFTPGSAMVQGEQFFAESAQACAILNRRGLLLTRHPDQIPKQLPPGVRHAAYAPFGLLLPHCAALVHHGGVGTTAQALRAGCPQLVMPMAHDQFDNANRVKNLGCGDWVGRGRYRAKRVARLLRPLVESPHVRESCRKIGGKFEGTTPLETAADLIEKLHASQVPGNAVIREH